MAKENKELLLKDLSARLPYDPIVRVGENYHPFKLSQRLRWVLEYGNAKSIEDLLDNIKPYLRPMSSMTPNEFEEFTNIVEHISIGKLQINIANPEAFDYLNARHFDYRGLIEKNLALEAPEGMYETKKQEN